MDIILWGVMGQTVGKKSFKRFYADLAPLNPLKKPQHK